MPTQEEIRIFDASDKYNQILSTENDLKTKCHISIHPNGLTKKPLSSKLKENPWQTISCSSESNQNRYFKTVCIRVVENVLSALYICAPVFKFLQNMIRPVDV